MNRIRYREKNTLVKYDLSEEFFSTLNIKVEDIIPLRKVFIIVTDKDKKILKKVDDNNEKLNFLKKVTDSIRDEYKNILKYNDVNDKNYIDWKGNRYILLDLVEGREATFTNPLDVKYCSEAIAKMHIASNNVFNKLSSEEEIENKGDYLPTKFMTDLKIVSELKEKVSKYKFKNKFDELFLENVDYYISELKRAINILAMCEYNSLIQDSSKVVVCHNDLAHHNFIIDGNEVTIIDFDYCNINIRAIDIANYILKVIKNQAFDKEKVKIVLDSYSNINKLENKEVKLIYAILNYPRDFITTVIDYYFKQKSWDEEVFITRFEEKLANEVYRKEFLESFINDFEEYFY